MYKQNEVYLLELSERHKLREGLSSKREGTEIGTLR